MKLLEWFGDLLVFPLVAIFYFLIYLDKFSNIIKMCYYKIMGIEYYKMYGKFGYYVVRK